VDYVADVVAPRSKDPKLIICVINFEVVQHICSEYINVTDKQTDGRTDGRHTIAIPRWNFDMFRSFEDITTSVWLYVGLCMYVCMYVICMYVCMYVCIYVCMYVCMTFLYVCIFNCSQTS